jgi:ribonuclease J
MEVVIHRGTHEIGGTCIQLSAGGRSILLDAGSPLGHTDSYVDLGALDFGAVLISHSHQDHYGLIERLDPETPVYIGEIGCQMVAAARSFTGKKPLNCNFKHFKAWEWFDISPFRIKPYLMDHSAADAFGFLIEADGQRVLYSGDFRAHGSKTDVFERFVAHPPKDIDLLLMEGTMLGRDSEAHKTEVDLSREMQTVLDNESGPAFLICSGQHIDRLCAAYRACKRAGRIFVVDIYTAWILHELGRFFDTTPHFRWHDIRVLAHGGTARSHYLSIRGKTAFKEFIANIYQRDNVIAEAQIASDPARYFIKNSRIDLLLKNLVPTQCSIIYSQWQGYLQERYNPEGAWKLTRLRDDPRVAFHCIHTSGHAFKKDLKRYADAVAAKVLVPVHTEYPDMFGEFKNVEVQRDGKLFTVGKEY